MVGCNNSVGSKLCKHRAANAMRCLRPQVWGGLCPIATSLSSSNWSVISAPGGWPASQGQGKKGSALHCQRSYAKAAVQYSQLKLGAVPHFQHLLATPLTPVHSPTWLPNFRWSLLRLYCCGFSTQR
jgi:hypothetical protein